MHGIIGLHVLLLIGIAWYFLRSSPTAAPTQSNAANRTVASPKKVPLKLSAEERRAATEALQALQGLRSVTEAGLNYSEYSRRLLDGKIQVDRYLNLRDGTLDLKRKTGEAIELYLFAGDAWNAKIREAYTVIGVDPRVEMCPLVRTLRDQARSSQYLSLDESRGISVAASVSLIWGCASAKIRDIEQELQPDKA